MWWAFEEGPRAFRWPLRFLMAVTVVLAVVSFVRESRSLAAWAADRWRAGSDRTAGPFNRAGVWIERLLAVGVALLVVVHVGLLMHQMAQTSLREDEIGTIGLYSGRGPVETVTKYNLAKNHVFFNLVNSVTPGSQSVHPFRARIWSFVAVTATLVVAGWWFFRKGEYAEGALVLAAVGFNLPQLAVSLEARGYGFLLCAACASALALPGILGGAGKSGRVALLSVATVLGVYTMPSYLVFGGALVLAVWVAVPSRRTFLAGWFALCALVLLYLPLASQLAQVAGEYDDRYADQFSDLKRMQFALRFLIPVKVFAFSDWSLVAGFGGLLALPALLGIHHTVRARAASILLGLTAGYYAFCLWLQTPPDRVTAFLAAPVAVALAFLFAEARLRFPRSRSALGIFLTALLCAGGGIAIGSFRYDSPQRWRSVALFIQTLFPKGTTVWVPGRYTGANAVYLGPDYPVAAGEPNRRAQASGNWVLHDDRFRTHPPVEPESVLPDRVQVPFVARGRATHLYFSKPASPSVTVEEVANGWSLRTDGPAYAIAVQADFDWDHTVTALAAKARPRADPAGTWRPVRFRSEGRFLAIQLPPWADPAEVSLTGKWKREVGEWKLVGAWAIPPRSETNRPAEVP